MNVSAEFLVEPFREGAPGPHVIAAIEAAGAAGLIVDLGPFGSVVSGEAEIALPALAAAIEAALAAGASRVTMNVSVVE